MMDLRRRRLINGISLGVTLIITAYILYRYGQLPEQINIHYNLLGEADRIGSKQTLLALPAIFGTLVLLGLWLQRFPQYFALPSRIRKGREQAVYQVAKGYLASNILLIALVYAFAGILLIHPLPSMVMIGAFLLILPTPFILFIIFYKRYREANRP